MQFDQQKLTLSADNGAIAAKLRQMTGEIAAGLREMGRDVTVIQILVQVSSPPRTPPHEVRSLGQAGEKHIAEFAEKLPGSPLKTALNRLLNQK